MRVRTGYADGGKDLDLGSGYLNIFLYLDSAHFGDCDSGSYGT